MDAQLHVVVGAAGATGHRVARNLVEAGCRVRAVTRNGRDIGVPGVEPVAADAADAAAIARVSGGAAAIHHCAMPPLQRWRTDFPPMTDALIAAAASSGARLVYADDTWMYGRVRDPMAADTPVRPASPLGLLRAFLAERMLRAADAGEIRLSIVRAGELYGPGVRSLIAGNVFGAAARGRPVVWFGDADLPITPSFIDDFARTLAVVGTRDASTSAIWHVPHPPATTGRALAAAACRRAATRLRLIEVGSRSLRALGVAVPLAREGADLVYQFEQPFVVDGEPTVRAFGLTPTSWDDGIAATLAAAR